MEARVYDLNLVPGNVPQIVKLNQYDKGITLRFAISEGSSRFQIPDDATVELSGTKPDGLGFIYPCTASGSEVSVVLGDQVTVLHGKVEAELTISIGKSIRIGTANFIFLIEAAALNDDTAVSESDFPAIIKAANNIDAAEKYASNAADSAKKAEESAKGAADAARAAIGDEVERAKEAEQAISNFIDGMMSAADYDADGNGIVDNAEKVNGHTVDEDVPAGAKFTDTVYDDTDIKKGLTDEIERAKKAEKAVADKIGNHTVEADVPKDAVFTDTIYDDAPVQKNTENLLSMGLENIDGVLNAVYEEE
jgi:hypothetical protein